MTIIDFHKLQEQQQASAPDAGIKTLSSLCEGALLKQQHITDLEAELKEAKAEYRRITEQEIPDLADDLGISKLELSDGAVVDIRDIVAARISEAKRAAAHQWLRENGFGDLIKNDLTISFGAGDDEIAEAAQVYAEENHFNYKRKQAVNYQTLNAFVREQVREGNYVPEDLLGVYRGRQAVIKPAK